MVAATAAKIGMKCRLVQESWVPHEDAVYDRVGNIMLSRIMGAEVRLEWLFQAPSVSDLPALVQSFGQLRLPMHMRVEAFEDPRQLGGYILPYQLKVLANPAIDAHEFEPFSKQ